MEQALGAIAALAEHGLYTPEVQQELQEMMDENYTPIEPDGDPEKYKQVQKMLRQMTNRKFIGQQQKSLSTVDSFLVKEQTVPLKPGKRNVGANISELVHAGKPQDVAVAIAMKESRKRKKRKSCNKFEALGQLLKKSCLDFNNHRS